MPRFITKTIHSYLDYPVAAGLLVMPVLFGLGASSPMAFWLSVVAGIAALVLTLLTDHDTGVFPIFPYLLHLIVDAPLDRGCSDGCWLHCRTICLELFGSRCGLLLGDWGSGSVRCWLAQTSGVENADGVNCNRS